MLIIDASCLFEVLAKTDASEPIRERLLSDPDHAAPHVVDVEVLGVIRAKHRSGDLERTAAEQALQGLEDWPGQRFAHRPFLYRVWELRENVRTWDAMYVALAEVFRAPLLTTDRRLAHASGPRCQIEVFDSSDRG